MALAPITSVPELHRHLYAAMQLEHATIPPYLTALYSIHPNTNSDAFHVIRAVLVEEMLHLTLAANMLNAVGGTPDLTRPDFVPSYPAYLPDGETDFQVDLQPFSKAAIQTFLKIERPARAAHEEARHVRRTRAGLLPPAKTEGGEALHFYSIGEFYLDISNALARLEAEQQKQGGTIFIGDPARQADSGYYYSGGGALFPVTDLATAQAAIRLISEQGEGIGGAIYDYEDEISHYYRFEQLLLGRHYVKGDTPGHPSGEPVQVDWDAVYPIKKNARVADYAEGSELRDAAIAFNRLYAGFLQMLTRAFTGAPELLIPAVGEMFRIKEAAGQLIRNPIDGKKGVNAAPTFEMTT